MKTYDYLENVKEDVRNYIEENKIVVTSSNREEVEQELNGTCSWSITGILQQKKGNGRFVSGKILKRDYRIIWQRIVIATAALCGMFIFMMAIQLMCWLSNLCNYVFR